MQHVRRILKRIKREPVLIAAVVSVATTLGLDDLAAQAGVEVTQQTVAAVIGVVLLATRGATNSRDHLNDVMDAESVIREAERD